MESIRSEICSWYPAVIETDRSTNLIIGTKVESAKHLLSGRIGPNETIIEVSGDFMRSIAIK